MDALPEPPPEELWGLHSDFHVSNMKGRGMKTHRFSSNSSFSYIILHIYQGFRAWSVTKA